MNRLLAVVVALSAGCVSGSFAPLPRQDEAIAIVWNQLYGEDDDAPSIEWIDGWINEDQRVAGMTWPGWKIQVMKCGDVTITAEGERVPTAFSGSTFAHELMHYHTYRRTGDVDVAHWRGDWELADRGAPDALREAGL